ncbi:hypothetical protein E8D34_15535 [Nocardioides sp. GY 10113]|uniref:hypothetical protein n=1 Tax=Nocardioides sp. GY 10113 TaxID=2569761 RepID=UPI0010A8637C|nr:hypothetical protein [Nocardioides sp. GY 10113]TIC83542.1 hypothetical protein E8D34_15535 [Nocardioides sp. GY 10113]
MLESAETPLEVPGVDPASIVWEDEIWVLARHDAGDRLGLTLHHREPEALGQLSDDHASQLGRIGNRLVRIIENLPDAGAVSLGRNPDVHAKLYFEVADVADDRLHEIAVKLSNWGGSARA